MTDIAVLGAGSWGTALAIQFARGGHEVTLWARRPEVAAELAQERVNEIYLPDAPFPESLRVTSEMEALLEAQVLVVVIPSHGFRAVVRELFAAWPADRNPVLVSATKGIEIDTLARMSGVCSEEATATGHEAVYGVLSGPTFAVELAAGVPSAAVIASEDEALAEELREILSDWNLRLYSSTDVVGVELAGAAKNVVAIASGVLTGVGLGHNTTAALITRGLHEISRLGAVSGGDLQTFYGLAGLGDLVLTCTGGLSRNRRTGLELAAGKTLEQIEAETMMVAEGVRNALAISRLAHREGIEMPITEQMRQVLYENKEPELAIAELMTRQLKSETEL